MSANTQSSSPAVYYDPRTSINATRIMYPNPLADLPRLLACLGWYANGPPYIVPNGQQAPVAAPQYPYYPIPAIYPSYGYASYGLYPAMPEKMISQPATTTSADSDPTDRPAAKRAKITAIPSGIWPTSTPSRPPATHPDSHQKDVTAPQYSIPLQHPQPYTPPTIPFPYYYPYMAASQPAPLQSSDIPIPAVVARGHTHTPSASGSTHKETLPPPIVTVSPPEDSLPTAPPPVVTVTVPEESPSDAAVSTPTLNPPPAREDHHQPAVESGFAEGAPSNPEDLVSDTVPSPSKIALPLSPVTNHQTMDSDPGQAMPSISSAMAELSLSEVPKTTDVQEKPDAPVIVDLRHAHRRPTPMPSLPIAAEVAPVAMDPADLPLMIHNENEREQPKSSRARPSRSDSIPNYHVTAHSSHSYPPEPRPVARARTFPYAVAPNAPPLHFVPPLPEVRSLPSPKPQGAIQSATSKLASKFRLRKLPPPIIPIPLNQSMVAMSPVYPPVTGPAAARGSNLGRRQSGDDSARPPSLTRSEYTTSTGTIPTPTSAAFPSSPTMQTPASSSSSKKKHRASRPLVTISFNAPGEKYYGFTNASPFKIYFNKKLYPTAEHLFHAFKFLPPRAGGIGVALSEKIRFGSGGIGAKVAEQVRCIPNAVDASREAERHIDYQREDWDEIELEKACFISFVDLFQC